MAYPLINIKVYKQKLCQQPVFGRTLAMISLHLILLQNSGLARQRPRLMGYFLRSEECLCHIDYHREILNGGTSHGLKSVPRSQGPDGN